MSRYVSRLGSMKDWTLVTQFNQQVAKRLKISGCQFAGLSDTFIFPTGSALDCNFLLNFPSGFNNVRSSSLAQCRGRWFKFATNFKARDFQPSTSSKVTGSSAEQEAVQLSCHDFLGDQLVLDSLSLFVVWRREGLQTDASFCEAQELCQEKHEQKV